ncbi:MAG TPA: SMC family ATPase, partial [Nitriliruptorales bacterium]|nr:SMC family ATPase [Nitriliruptorales bacterium]
MRPIRLELEGFASFRERAEVDFDGAELFALTGATGSGKSSLLDALIFCLYGSVPRYGDRRLVAPVISHGRVEARVSLEFGVRGGRYTAVRLVRRTAAGGATTREARLQDAAGTTLAGNEKELTAAVESLLGLTFEHFCRCVVLPQGEFQEFLHARPKDRQDLLVRLLDIDIYRRVGVLARERTRIREATIEVLTRRLEEELAGATQEAVAAATARVQALDA